MSRPITDTTLLFPNENVKRGELLCGEVLVM